jgi:CheY-like chemotaxis protein
MNGKRILIIEDNLNDAEQLRYILRETGWSIETVKDAREAQRSFLRGQFHFVFVDLQIPDMDGVALIRWIKEHYPSVPIAIVSGFPDERKRAQMMDCGAVFMFPKPFTSGDLKYILNFMDVMEAIFKMSTKVKPSWRTTLAGFSVIGLGAWSMFRHPDSTGAALIAAGIGLLTALDERALRMLLKRK